MIAKDIKNGQIIKETENSTAADEHDATDTGNAAVCDEYIAGEYDIVVVGAGHAGCEAALAGARLGMKTLILSINLDSIANMPCNPNIGGTGKGHLVREVDALGGEMGKAADHAMIQSRMLNRAKGPAVYSLRAQIDRREYQRYMKRTLEEQENLDVRQAEAVELLMETSCCRNDAAAPSARPRVAGVRVRTGAVFRARAVVLTTGTYLKAKVIIGEFSINSGPDGLFPANSLSECLRDLGVRLYRFKTGTPARVNGRSLDYSKMEEQPGDARITPFSFTSGHIGIEQASCWLTHTNEETHEIIRQNLSRSPLFSGQITGTGARYCPSIEDKIVRFAERRSHQVFIEPMGTGTREMYLQGLSSSMPEDVQERFIHSIPGLESAKITRSAYAIEYDCIDPTQLRLSLELKDIAGLFTAGQINGTSGYEEAAAQGIVAGINAAMALSGRDPLILKRSDGYIGVLIDDLATKGTNEPYRMMTSRAEYRLLLRQDNADIRLTPYGYDIGLIGKERYERFLARKKLIEDEIQRVKSVTLPPSREVLELLASIGSTPISTGAPMAEILRRPEITYASLADVDAGRPDLAPDVGEQVEISIKYEGYIKRQLKEIEQFRKLEAKPLPAGIQYSGVRGLSIEGAQKLDAQKPESVGQASRISGVSPSDISVLLIWLRQNNGATHV
ncbi:MAG: tRNA uridine-5-carboxymethylaminomethyl(34) synthesis enzyme MnmG [Oscillospiraceae bacterium]|nr:tRNA uridine-5-carboxymethylaminomethyl(34) synthesis enzyme MnmG [Oscillospiraceae bacterium]